MSGAWLNRAAALAIFGGVEYVAELLMPLAPRNEFYYAFCVIFNLAEIVLCISILDAGQLSLDLVRLALIQAILQVMGYAIYEARIPVGIYNYSIHFTVIVTFIRIFLWWMDGEPSSDSNRDISDSGTRLDGRDSNPVSQRTKAS